MEYKVSVIVPVYKAEKYLEKCLDSLLAQTLDAVEILLIDDGSPDRCGAICDQYAKQNDHIRVFHLENGGPSRARNIGLENARGQYVGFVDADDYIEPDMFAELYGAAQSCKAEMAMCSYYIDSGNSMNAIPMKYKSEYRGREAIQTGLAARYCKISHNGLYSVCNKLFDNIFLQTRRIRFDEELIRAEDAWFVFECLKYVSCVRYIDRPLYHYRQVATSTMHTIQSDRFARSKAFREKLEKEALSLGIVIDYSEFYYEFLYEAFVFCRAMIQQENKDKIKKVLDDDFFYNACKYNSALPIHLRILCKLERLHFKGFILILLKLWKSR